MSSKDKLKVTVEIEPPMKLRLEFLVFSGIYGKVEDIIINSIDKIMREQKAKIAIAAAAYANGFNEAEVEALLAYGSNQGTNVAIYEGKKIDLNKTKHFTLKEK